MISRFFIDRPIFASVLSIVITLAGGIALLTLPVAQYPQISPPTVSVDCSFPGASAQVVAETIATPIEEKVNGVEDMLYMSSQCTNDGSYNLTVTFKHGVDLNVAQVLVQNCVSLAVPLLPDVLKQTGVNVRKRSPDILLSIAINSPGGLYDQLFLSNYALLHVREEILRVPGVSDVVVLGQRDYSMRIWLDPDLLASRDMTAGDVVRAIRAQNTQVATGQIGQPPMATGQATQITLSTLGRLVEKEEFERIVVKTSPDGRIVRVKDVARVELGSKNQDINVVVNGKPSVSLTIFQLPDANALTTADAIKAKIELLKADFPEGVGYEVRYDTTPFIRESIEEVYKTLYEAIALVAIVVLLFLQDWRSAVIPLVAVPVAIVGTFAAMAILGFSLNNLTLFGLVLAIGIVVDDAIVVVEAVEHHMHQGLEPRAATIRAMDEVSGPVIAIALVLTAVFIPCAFISGIVGQFFKQFALTIATSTVISAFNSLTLSPALAAILLKPKRAGERTNPLPWVVFVLAGAYLAHTRLVPRLELWSGFPLKPWVFDVCGSLIGATIGGLLGPLLNRMLGGLFRGFNRAFGVGTRGYTRGVGLLLRISPLVILGYGGLLYLTHWSFTNTPTGFIPSQDMGYLLINVQLPDSASAERTRAVMVKLDKIARFETDGIRFVQTNAGQSMLLSANGSNFGSMFAILDTFANRREPLIKKVIKQTPDGPKEETVVVPLDSESIAARLRKQFEAEVPEAMMTVLGPPPVRGVGRAGGFKMMIEDRGDNGPRMLQAQAEKLIDEARKELASGYVKAGESESALVGKRNSSGQIISDNPPGAFVGLATVFRAGVPQLYADINRQEVVQKNVALQDLFDTVRTYLGSLYVNDFNRFGRTWQVIVQAEARFRNDPKNASRLKVRNLQGKMVPLGALATVKEKPGPLILSRYNMYPSAPVNGSSAPGVSSGEGIAAMEKLATKNLEGSMSYEWTELAFLELQAGNTAMTIFAIAVVMVFLVLAAQYESWSLPLAIILVVPMCLLSAIVGVRYVNADVNIFTQIGFVVLVGLASKNAILIVEFAKMRKESGVPTRQAALEACALRLRPIVMTSLAFILGVSPLMVSKGAGAEMRRTLGITVFSGMLGVTLFGLVLTPVFFYVIEEIGESRYFGTSSPVRKIGNFVLAGLSLSFLRPPQRRTRPPKPKRLSPKTAPVEEFVDHK